MLVAIKPSFPQINVTVIAASSFQVDKITETFLLIELLLHLNCRLDLTALTCCLATLYGI